jgi:DNA-binding transcriptional LysR family regulator
MPHPRRAHMQRLAAAWGKALNVAAEAGAISAQASFVRQGLGYAVMPFSAANLMKSSGPLEIAPIEDLASWRLLVRRGDRQPSQATIVVSEMIVELFGDGLAPLYGAAAVPAEMDEVG